MGQVLGTLLRMSLFVWKVVPSTLSTWFIPQAHWIWEYKQKYRWCFTKIVPKYLSRDVWKYQKFPDRMGYHESSLKVIWYSWLLDFGISPLLLIYLTLARWLCRWFPPDILRLYFHYDLLLKTFCTAFSHLNADHCIPGTGNCSHYPV